MSQTAAYRALGQGLLFAGQDLAARRDENARARREASLLQLRRAWQLDDRDWEVKQAEKVRDEEREYDTRIWEERERPTQEARRDLLESQAQYYRDRGQQTSEKGVFGVVRPDAYTPESLQAFQEQFQATGQKNWSLLEPRSELNEQQKIEAEAEKRAAELAEEFLPIDQKYGDPVQHFVASQPDQAQAFGVTVQDSYPAALRKIQEGISAEFRSAGQERAGTAREGQEPSGTLNDPIPVESLDGPPEPGTYVVREGQVMQWDGEKLIRVR